MVRESLVSGLLVVLGAVAGCGGGGAAPGAGPMPEGGDFTGVWHSPQYGEMQMQVSGQQVVGCYVQNERTGRIQGSVQGNLMRFEWSERREMVVGRPTLMRGRGYFVYTVGADGDHYIQGQWGPDERESGGGPWRAVRDRRRQRRPDTSCGQGGAGGDSEPRGDSFSGGGGTGGTGGTDSTGGGSTESGSGDDF